MRLVIKSTVLAVAFVVTALGFQGPPSPQEMVDRQIGRMKDRLSLSASQEESIRPILLKAAEESRALREKVMGQGRSEESMQMMRTESEKIRDRTSEELSKILNEEQMAEYRKMLEEQASRRGRGRRPPGA